MFALYLKNTMITATLCYIRDSNKTLMINRNKKPGDIHLGKWNGVGGKCQLNEHIQECAFREIYEETGFLGGLLCLKGEILFPKFDSINDWKVFIFEGRKFHSSCPSLFDCKEGELSWVLDKEILSLNLWEGDRIFIPWLYDSKFYVPYFKGRFYYKNKKLSSYSVQFFHSVDGNLWIKKRGT